MIPSDLLTPTRANAVSVSHTPPNDVPAQLLAVWARLEPIQKVLERSLPIVEDGIADLQKYAADVRKYHHDYEEYLADWEDWRQGEMKRRAEVGTMLRNLVPELQKLAAGVTDLQKMASSGGAR